MNIENTSNTKKTYQTLLENMTDILVTVFAKEMTSDEFQHEYTQDRRIETIETLVFLLKTISKTI